MIVNLWDTLPNAKHIDLVLASVKAKPGAWTKAYNATWHSNPGYPPLAHARAAAITASKLAARDSAWKAAWDAAWKITQTVGQIGNADDIIWDTIISLIAYDDSAKYLDMPLDQLKMLYALTEHPACLLLQPAVQAFAMERELA